MGYASKDHVSTSKYISIFNGVGPADQTAVEVDMVQDGVVYRQASVIWVVGDEGSNVLSSNTKLELILKHSDTAGSGQTDVTAVDVIGDVETTIAGGIVTKVDAPAKAPGVYKIGYVGPRRYLTVDLESTGSFSGSVPVSSVIVELSQPSVAPV